MSDHIITCTYLNIRQSITILLARIVAIDIISAFLVVGGYILMVMGSNLVQYTILNPYLFLYIFFVIGLTKVVLNIYSVLQWLNEYYEITPEYIVHKKGVIFRKSEKYRVDQIRAITLHDTFLGQIFNYASISIYDLRLNKRLSLYLIHNPHRYVAILKQLRPNLEIREESVHMPLDALSGDNNEETTEKTDPAFI